MNTKKRAIALILYVALCFSIAAGVLGNPNDNSKIDAQIGELLNSLSSEFVKCDCGTEGSLEKHDASCARVKECHALAANNTASELYSKWDNFPEDACEYILAYLSQNAPDKYLVLKYALDNTETKYEKFDSDLTIEEDTVAVEVMAPEGAFNDGTAMSVEVKDVDKISKADKNASKDAVNAIGDDVTALDVVKSVDITFAQKNNPEMTNLQPKDEVLLSVSLKRSDFSANAVNAALVHIADDGSREVVGYVGLPTDNDATVELKAWVGGFSEYVVVESTGEYEGTLLSTAMKNDADGTYLGQSIKTFPVTLFDYHGGEINKYFWENINTAEISKDGNSYTDHASTYFAFYNGTAYYDISKWHKLDGGYSDAYKDTAVSADRIFTTVYFKDRNDDELTQYQSYLKRNTLTKGLGGKIDHAGNSYDGGGYSPNPSFGNINGIGINQSLPSIDGIDFAKQGIVNAVLNSKYKIPELNFKMISGLEQMRVLFDPSYTGFNGKVIPSAARSTYDAQFEFIYNESDGSYSYSSSKNHAQFVPDSEGASKGTVKLYEETVAAAAGMISLPMIDKDGMVIDTVPTYSAINDPDKMQMTANGEVIIPKENTTNIKWSGGTAIKISNIDYAVYSDGAQFIRYDVTDKLKETEDVSLIFNDFGVAGIDGNTGNINLQNKYILIKYRAYDGTTWKESYSENVLVHAYADNQAIVSEKISAEKFTNFKDGWISVLIKTDENANANADKLTFKFYHNGTAVETGHRCFLDIAEVAVMDKDAMQKDRTGAHGQFFPFADISDTYCNPVTTWTDGQGDIVDVADRTLAISGSTMPDEAAHFGMSMAVDFYLPESRRLYSESDPNGQQIRFSFSGDDDLWVFIDDELVLDIGGMHGQVDGTFLFMSEYEHGADGSANATDKREYADGYRIKSWVRNAYELGTAGDTGYDADNANLGASISYHGLNLESGHHTMRIFYLERGACESNCDIKFNLPIIPAGAVYIQNDVDYTIAETDVDDENNLVSDNWTDAETRKFLKDDFEGKLYDFKVVYSTAESNINWETGTNVFTSSMKYSLYKESQSEIISGLLTSASGVLSVPAGWIAVVEVPGQTQTGAEVKSINVIELGAVSHKAANFITPPSHKAYTNLPGNYDYADKSDVYSYYQGDTDSQKSEAANNPIAKNLEEANLNSQKQFKGYTNPLYFFFTNYYTWQIDFDTEFDTEISDGDESTTFDIDEDVKVTFENKLGEENWLDGEGSADNDYGDGSSNHYPTID